MIKMVSKLASEKHSPRRSFFKLFLYIKSSEKERAGATNVTDMQRENTLKKLRI
jgi:hypothetical protein